MILWQWFVFQWLRVRLGFWSLVTLLGVRACKRSLRSFERPSWLVRKFWPMVNRWNDRRTRVVLALTDHPRGRWHGEAHPVQQWTERDPHKSPQWWKAHAPSRRKGGAVVKMVGTMAMCPPWVKPPCDWPGCRDSADTTGRVPPTGRLANVCSEHKVRGDGRVMGKVRR